MEKFTDVATSSNWRKQESRIYWLGTKIGDVELP